MNFWEAFKTKKKMTRRGWRDASASPEELDYYFEFKDMAEFITRGDMEAEDWEVEEPYLRLTRSQLRDKLRDLRWATTINYMTNTTMENKLEPEARQAIEEALFGPLGGGGSNEKK